MICLSVVLLFAEVVLVFYFGVLKFVMHICLGNRKKTCSYVEYYLLKGSRPLIPNHHQSSDLLPQKRKVEEPEHQPAMKRGKLYSKSCSWVPIIRLFFGGVKLELVVIAQ